MYSDLALVFEVDKSSHGFLYRRNFVEPMDVVDVNI